MTTLFEAVNEDNFRTANGMKTLGSSLNSCLDLFFLFGASRGKNIDPAVSAAGAENLELAIRIALWGRDVRGGAGERKTFRDAVLLLLLEHGAEKIGPVLKLIPEIGRWDDLLVFLDTELEDQAVSMIGRALKDGNGLCAKWMPRKGEIAAILRRRLGLTPKQYRKTLVNLTKVVETQMCSKKWDEIEYGKLPSLASARYQKAFGRNDTERYGRYIESLQKGTDKINAGAVYPYDVVKSLRYGNVSVAVEQWKALPDYLEGSTRNIMPVVDVSGSMNCQAGGITTCMDVAVSLGMYISERSKGAFKDVFMTFSESPQLVQLKGDLQQRHNQLRRADWGFSTNLEGCFNLILNAAIKYNVPESQMPTDLLILSDMEFNGCVAVDDRAINMIRKKYENSGYKLPNVVFWNLNGRQGNVPVKFNEKGTALVSGFSPAIMKSILVSDTMDPTQIMLNTVMVDRYNFK